MSYVYYNATNCGALCSAGVLLQIVCSHLAAARRLFVKEREAYAAAMKHYKNRLELEELKQKLLKEAGEHQCNNREMKRLKHSVHQGCLPSLCVH